jgi:hypothetical protein
MARLAGDLDGMETACRGLLDRMCAAAAGSTDVEAVVERLQAALAQVSAPDVTACLLACQVCLQDVTHVVEVRPTSPGACGAPVI